MVEATGTEAEWDSSFSPANAATVENRTAITAKARQLRSASNLKIFALIMNVHRLATIILRPVQPEIARAVMQKLCSFNADVLVKRRRFFPRVQYWAMQVAEFVVGSNEVRKNFL